MGVQVYINGTFLPGNSLVNPNATHVNGFVPFIVDISNYLNQPGVDNVLAVKVSRGDAFFNTPAFSGAYRFGQSDAGLFRPVTMYVTDKIHIPRNTYSVLNTWGTYVSTVDASSVSADVRIQTNVLNEYSDTRNVSLTTQIVDQSGQVVAQDIKAGALAPSPQPVVPAKTTPTNGAGGADVRPDADRQQPASVVSQQHHHRHALHVQRRADRGREWCRGRQHDDSARHPYHQLGPELSRLQRPADAVMGCRCA